MPFSRKVDPIEGKTCSFYLSAVKLNHKILGAGEPLVVLHGLFGMLDNWQTVARELAKSRMVVLVDLRNHGKSPHHPQHDYPSMAADLAAFLSDNWMHQVDLLGHSMGGKVAMQFAVSYPGRVRKLIVVDMTPRAYPGGHEEILRAMAEVPVATGESAKTSTLSRKQIDEQLAVRIEEPGVRQFLLKNLRRERSGGYAWKMNLAALALEYPKVLAAITGEPWNGAALFVRGGRSRYVRDEDWVQVTALFPSARLETIADAGHWVHAEAPAALIALVEGFLGEESV